MYEKMNLGRISGMCRTSAFGEWQTKRLVSDCRHFSKAREVKAGTTQSPENLSGQVKVFHTYQPPIDKASVSVITDVCNGW